MKLTVLSIFLIVCTNTIAGQWVVLANTGIQKISLRNDWEQAITHFKKDSSLITVPDSLQNEFSELFLHNIEAFKSITNACAGLKTGVIGDSLQDNFQKTGIKYSIYFTDRIIIAEGNIVLWGMTSLWGQGQPCWPVIYLKKPDTYNEKKLRFYSIDRGLCEL